MNNIPESHRWVSLYTARRLVIACATVIEEMSPFLPEDVSSETLDFGLHLRPGELKKSLQEKIDQSSQHADVLLPGYGLCSMAVVGRHATTSHLVIPRVMIVLPSFSVPAKRIRNTLKKSRELTISQRAGLKQVIPHFRKIIASSKNMGKPNGRHQSQL